MTEDVAPETQVWWAQAALERVWALVSDRLEREGLLAQGQMTIGELSRDERRAVSDLVGRPVLGATTKLDLAHLDARLRQRAGMGVVEAAGRARGHPLTDRPAARKTKAARREAPYAAYRAWRCQHPEVAWAGLDAWLEGLRRDGMLGRDPQPAELVRNALDVLWHQREHLNSTSTSQSPPVARTELAAQLLGDAHALDDDRRLAAAVLRAVGAVTSSVVGPEATAVDERAQPLRRAMWEQLGVLSDRVSSTCLTLGLRARPGTVASQRLTAYAVAGAVLHLTWRDLDDGLAFEDRQTVLVCENPRVVESAAEQGVAGLGVVCTSGRPALVTIDVLARLAASRCRLLYHGDFDWAGVAMANDLVRRCGVIPWRMSADDYLGLPAQLPLTGRPQDAVWDPELGPAMAHRGLAVHEEATLPALTLELAQPSRG